MILLLLGCDGECLGPGCDALYTRSLLAVHEAPWQGLASPTQGLAALEGLDLGRVQGLAATDGVLLVGLPDQDQVRVVAPFGSELEGATRGLLQGAGGQWLGQALAVVPDLDGDERAELWVGAPHADRGQEAREAGAAYLFEDRGGSWSGTLDVSEAWLTVAGSSTRDHLGERVGSCADLDGDGLPELLVSALWDSQAASLAGAVHGLPSTELAGLEGLVQASSLPLRWELAQEGAQLGRALDCSHDLDGDGVPELVLGAPFADGEGGDATGTAFVLSGAELEGGEVDRLAWRRFSGLASQDYAGSAVATGDLDGDGRAELVLGAPGWDGGRGAVFVYGPTAILSENTVPDVLIEGAEVGDRLGAALRVADLDGDGASELLVGAPRHDPTGLAADFGSGALYLFVGGEAVGDWPRLLAVSQADGVLTEGEAYLGAGANFAVGELDGDAELELVLALKQPAEP